MLKNMFLRGAMALTAAGIVVKLLGGVNRILLSRILGGEGIGLYQIAYPVYVLGLSIAGAGVPIALSVMVAEKIAQGDSGGARRIFRIILIFMTIVAVFFGAGLFLGVEGLGEMIRRGVGSVPGPRLVENANQFECRHAVHTKSMNERDLVVLILVNGHL